MKHFTDEACLDFVRGLVPESDTKAMQQHLDSGCEKCHKLCAVWRAVGRVINNANRDEVPQDLLAGTQAAFATWRWQTLIPQRARIARLVFDSRLEQVRAGLRSQTQHARRVLHRMGPWAIDLRIEPEAGNRMYLAGQVLRSGRAALKTGTVEVLLARSDKLIAQAAANQFGEFQLECEHSEELTVYVDIPGQLPIAVELHDLGDGDAGPNDPTSPVKQ